jgi:hypothetical protein
MSADERQGTEARLRLAAELAVRGGRMLLAPFHRVQIAAGLDDPGAEAHAAVRDHLGAEIATAFPDDALVEVAVRSSALSRASLIAVGNTCEPGVPPFTEEWLRRHRVRRTGSTALHLCYVAMGALDLVHDHRATLREIAGAAAIVTEAGGIVTREDGGPVFPATRSDLAGRPLAVLAGNPASHREVPADVRAALPKIYGGVIVP